MHGVASADLRGKYNRSETKRACVAIKTGHASVSESIHTTHTEQQQTVKAAEAMFYTCSICVSLSVAYTRHTCL